LFLPPYEQEERYSVGAHEVAHLKYRHSEKVEDKKAKGLFWLAIPTVISIFCFALFKMAAIFYLGFGISFSIGPWRLYVAHRYQKISEFEADRFAADNTSPAALISYLKKREKDRERWKKKGFVSRIKVCYHDFTHPSLNERIEHLKKLQQSE